MENLDNIKRVISWNTTKTESGFSFFVYSFDYQEEKVTHHAGVRDTRAKAASQAKKSVRWLKSFKRCN